MRHVALLLAPTVLLCVPAGQSVALKEEKGQKAPAVHSTGPPLAQKKPAGQGWHCSLRSLLFPASVSTREPSAASAVPYALASAALVPKPSAKPCTDPASVLTAPEARLTARTRPVA